MFKNPHNRRPANALKSKDEIDRTSAFEIHLFLALNRTRVFTKDRTEARCSARVRLSRRWPAGFAADAGVMQIQLSEGCVSHRSWDVRASTQLIPCEFCLCPDSRRKRGRPCLHGRDDVRPKSRNAYTTASISVPWASGRACRNVSITCWSWPV
jgi:hypothetical protein